MFDHPVLDGVICVSALAALVLAYFAVRAAYRAGSRAVRRFAENRPAEDILTIVAASIATSVSAQGMWRFSGDVLGLSGPLRLLLFAFIEVAVITSAVRARRNMRENFSAGIDGIAVWALTSLSAVLSSMDAGSIAEFTFRLAAPLVAAWLWERGMAIERHRITGRKRIHLRFTLERILVFLGIAEAKGRTTDEVDTQRRLTTIALAAQKARDLRESGSSDRKLRAAMKRLKRAMAAAEQHVGLDEAKQQALKAQIAALYSTDQLLDVEAASAWTTGPAEPPEMAEEAKAAIKAYEEWQRPRLVPFPLTALPSGVTYPVTPRPVTPPVTNGVANGVTDTASAAPAGASSVTRDVIPDATVAVTGRGVTEKVTERVTFDVTDPDVFDLERPLSDDPDVTDPVTPGVTDDDVTEQVTDEVADDDPDTLSKTAKMRAHWDAAIVDKRYPSVAELSEVSGAHHSLASRKRQAWVAELPWREKRKASPRREKASA